MRLKAMIVLMLAASIFCAGVNEANNGDWIELFNGKDMTGWKMAGKGSFKVEDGAMVTYGGMGLLWYEAKRFRDFVLEIEWKVNHSCNNSGIFVRFPEKSDDPWHAVNHGYEIQIDDCDKRGLKYNTGSIYDFSPATRIASKKAGEWNRYEITVIGQRYTIKLNGEKVNEFDGSRGAEGYIGLQNHDIISRVSYRRVRVKELTSK